MPWRLGPRIFLHPLYNQNVPHDYDFAIVQLDKAPILKKTHLKRRFGQGPLQEIGGNRNYSRHFCQSRQEKANDIQHDSLIQNNHGLRSLQRCLLLAIQLGMFLDITIFKGTIHHHYLLRRP